jgi:hypothetical protein
MQGSALPEHVVAKPKRERKLVVTTKTHKKARAKEWAEGIERET